MRASVIVCTHNPRRAYLERVGAALEAQALSREEWELLVIDNRSEPALSLDVLWHPHSRVIREEELGLSSARARGIGESAGDVLVFVDDDNLLARDYLQQALRIAVDWPQLGIWGGSSIPEFEVPPPPHLKPHLGSLALREVRTARWSNDWSCQEAEPHGAGLCIRRSAALAYREFYGKSQLRVGDRTGQSLTSGGDSEMAFFVTSLGLGMGVFPELKLTHLIPSSRLTDDYIARIAEGLETSSMLLFYKWAGTVPPSPYSPRELARALKHFVMSRGLERKLVFGRRRACKAVRRMVLAQPRSPGSAPKLSVIRA